MTYILASLEPCYEHNPILWRVFCVLTNRNFAQPNYNWTEHDVAQYLILRGLNRDTRKFENTFGEFRSIKLGLVDDSGSDRASS